ncbi:MAG: hypothetical protein ACRDH6_01030 [Actinomycetota bacterium]
MKRETDRMGQWARRPAAALLAMGLGLVLAASACTANQAAGSLGGDSTRLIPQPDVKGLQVAPESQRVDLQMPTFSDPTNITNPLFPVSSQESVLLLGRVDGLPFRTEVTTLPDTRVIEWNDQRIEALVSQYVAFLGGRLEEVAYDFYAQDDSGAVWYLGEDVFNFRDGAIVNTHGTWIAGKDGPGALIMPADPKVGDVYRPENIPGFVFEEVTVKAVGETVDGPFGPMGGALLIEELHMDGFTEDKLFAPGYGEFYTSGGGNTEAAALAVSADALSEPAPAELTTLSTGALEVFDAARSGDWSKAAARIGNLTAAWESYRAGEVPVLVEPIMTKDLDALARAVEGRNGAAASQAAIDVARSSLDLQLRYRPVVEIDVARFDLWLAQILVDVAAADSSSVTGDFFSLDYVRDRIQKTLQGTDLTRINTQLEALYEAVSSEKLGQAADAAQELRGTIAER